MSKPMLYLYSFIQTLLLLTMSRLILLLGRKNVYALRFKFGFLWQGEGHDSWRELSRYADSSGVGVRGGKRGEVRAHMFPSSLFRELLS